MAGYRLRRSRRQLGADLPRCRDRRPRRSSPAPIAAKPIAATTFAGSRSTCSSSSRRGPGWSSSQRRRRRRLYERADGARGRAERPRLQPDRARTLGDSRRAGEDAGRREHRSHRPAARQPGPAGGRGGRRRPGHADVQLPRPRRRERRPGEDERGDLRRAQAGRRLRRRRPCRPRRHRHLPESATLHRVEEVLVRREVEAAGFRLAAEGMFLRNPADPRDREEPDPPQPKDEFVLRFVKP